MAGKKKKTSLKNNWLQAFLKGLPPGEVLGAWCRQGQTQRRPWVPGFRQPVRQLEWVLLLQPGPSLTLPLGDQPKWNSSMGEQRWENRAVSSMPLQAPRHRHTTLGMVGPWAWMPAGGLSPRRGWSRGNPRVPSLHPCSTPFSKNLSLSCLDHGILPGFRLAGWRLLDYTSHQQRVLSMYPTYLSLSYKWHYYYCPNVYLHFKTLKEKKEWDF